MKGLFVTLEGGEGAGKTSLLKSLEENFRREKIPALLTRAPGATALGLEIRKLLLDPRFEIDPLAELFLFFADRQQQIVQEIQPALKKGFLVVCDRFHDSTIAYQGRGRGLGDQRVKDLVINAFPPLVPDLTLILDVPPEVGIKRKSHQQILDRMEEEELSFHEKIRAYFHDLEKKESNRCILIDATKPQDEVAKEAYFHIFNKWGLRIG